MFQSVAHCPFLSEPAEATPHVACLHGWYCQSGFWEPTALWCQRGLRCCSALGCMLQ